MKNFIRNWNFKKQMVAESMFYSSVALIGNAFFEKKSGGAEKLLNPVKACVDMPKRQKCFNLILFGCFVADMTASCFLLKYMKKIVK